jgi:hypothetical protein
VRQIATLARVSPSTVAALVAGTLVTLGAAAAARLLACPPRPAPGALVAATRARRALDSLRRDGYTQREIAWHLGARSQQLQVARRRIRVRTAVRIARVYERLAAE